MCYGNKSELNEITEQVKKLKQRSTVYVFLKYIACMAQNVKQ